MKRDIHQRRAAALRRLSLAVDRSIRASSPAEKARAARWAAAWGRAAGLRPQGDPS
jgi:hypothetical protein